MDALPTSLAFVAFFCFIGPKPTHCAGGCLFFTASISGFPPFAENDEKKNSESNRR